VLRIRTSLGLAVAVVMTACGDGGPVEPPIAPDAAQAPAPTGADTARTPAPTPPPNGAPRADSIGITITPSPYLAPGRSATLTAVRLSNTSTSTPIAGVAWESADTKVATVANGVVTAVALGIAPIRAQVEGRWLQVFITVTADGQRPQPAPTDTGRTRPPADTAGRGPTTPPAYVGEFTLSGRVFDATPGPDSATFRPIAGVTLKLVAVTDSGQPITPERVAGTATTDANGQFTLPKAPGGWYRLDVTPPEGSGYRFSSVLVSRPVRAELRYDLALRKQP
jgi:hypothetical protein